jgi:hypothetical protein
MHRVRRVVSVCLGALACLFVIGLSRATAEEQPPNSTTTTSPASTIDFNSTTTMKSSTSTTAKPATTTTVANGGRPVPPPAAGPTQTLVPDLLGTPVDVQTSTTSTTEAPFGSLNPGTLPTNVTTPISTNSDSPSGLTLVLAAIAWLASFGGLLVYAEDKRAANWKHLAR